MTQKSDDFPWIPLNKIEIHKSILGYQDKVDLNYLLKQADRFTLEGVLQLLTLHPILVINKRNRFLCIAGIRQLNIATMSLDKDKSIPVRLLKGLTGEQIKELYLADLFLTPLIFSIDNPRIIDTIRQAAGTAAGKWTELANYSKGQLAKAFGLSTAALYYDRKTTKRG